MRGPKIWRNAEKVEGVLEEVLERLEIKERREIEERAGIKERWLSNWLTADYGKKEKSVEMNERKQRKMQKMETR